MCFLFASLSPLILHLQLDHKGEEAKQRGSHNQHMAYCADPVRQARGSRKGIDPSARDVRHSQQPTLPLLCNESPNDHVAPVMEGHASRMDYRGLCMAHTAMLHEEPTSSPPFTNEATASCATPEGAEGAEEAVIQWDHFHQQQRQQGNGQLCETAGVWTMHDPYSFRGRCVPFYRIVRSLVFCC